MSELLLEYYCEELPDFVQQRAIKDLEKHIKHHLSCNFAGDISCVSYCTPTRLTFVINNIPSHTEESLVEKRGPKVGASAVAKEGFKKTYGVKDDSELEERDGYYYYVKKTPAKPAKEAIGSIIEEATQNFTWARSMRWGTTNMRWIRPVKNILCLLDGEVVDMQIEELKANNLTFGHKFLYSDALVVNSVTEYQDVLAKHKVILSREKRKGSIRAQIDEQANALGLKLIEDEGLLETITSLVEYPTVYIGSIENDFMKLPKEVLLTVLKTHQKCLMLEDFNGDIAPKFVIVSNNIPEDGGKQIVAGNERVVKARLTDAKFFYETDIKTGIEQMQQKLKSRVYHQKIGSMFDKTIRIAELAEKLSEFCDVDAKVAKESAMLSKFDLVSEMVAEFPELQGVMGGYYCANDNLANDVAIGVREHYKPQGLSDSLPNNKVAAVVSIADKLDSIMSLFAVNIKPTGSKDPFALRRAAIGIGRIMEEFKLDIPFAKLGANEEVIGFIQEKTANL